MSNLADLLKQAQAIRPEIYSVKLTASFGQVLDDPDTYSTCEFLAQGIGGGFWAADSPEELLKDIKEWS